MNIRQLCDIALNAAEILLCSGGEIYRVEETIDRIFLSYGKSCDSFILLSGIFISTIDESGHEITLIRRIDTHSFDLRKIEKINSFSRSLEKNPVTYVEAIKILNDIKKPDKYSKIIMTLAAGFTALVYTILFGGKFLEGLAAFFISFIAYPIKDWVSRTFSFQFLEFFTGGFITGILAITFSHIFPDLNLSRMVIGGIMIMVPGVAMTTGLKDALYGDTVSSIYRITDAIFISVAVGVGIAMAIAVGGMFI